MHRQMNVSNVDSDGRKATIVCSGLTVCSPFGPLSAFFPAGTRNSMSYSFHVEDSYFLLIGALSCSDVGVWQMLSVGFVHFELGPGPFSKIAVSRKAFKEAQGLGIMV